MKYNFDEVFNRSTHRSSKYDELNIKFGTTDVIPLWVADMDFKTAQPIIDRLTSKAQEGIFGYVSRPSSYFKAGADWQEKRNGWKIDTDLCSWSIGVVPAMCTMAEIFGKGSNILIQTPIYGEFYEVVENTGNTVIENKLIELNGQWSIDWNDFEEKIKNVSMFLLCNPHNPTGNVWDKDTISKMIDLCYDNNVLVISDEIHSDLIFTDKKFISASTVSEKAKECVITCFSATKTFNLAGLQACTIVFPNQKLKGEFDYWWKSRDIHRNNSFSSVAMEVCYTEGEEWLSQVKEYIAGNFEFVCNYIDEKIPQIKVKAPQATYLMWLDCRNLNMTNEELNDFMIHKAGLGLNSGSSFSRDLTGYMRMNVACPRSVLKKALQQLEIAINNI